MKIGKSATCLKKTNILLPLPAVENIRRPSVKPNRRNTLALQGVTQVCCAESKISLRMCGLMLLALLLLWGFIAVGVALYCHPLDVRIFYLT